LFGFSVIQVWVVAEFEVHYFGMFPANMLQQDLVVPLIRFTYLVDPERDFKVVSFPLALAGMSAFER